MPKVAENLKGKRFREWYVVERVSSSNSPNAMWLCRNVNTGALDVKPACSLKACATRQPREVPTPPPVGTMLANWKVASGIVRSNNNYCVLLECKCGATRLVSVRSLHKISKQCIDCHLAERRERRCS